MPFEEAQSLDVTQGRTARSRGARIGRVVTAVAAAAAMLFVSAGSADAGGTSTTEPTVGRALFDPNFTHGLVTVEGTPIHYVRGGSGPAILLVHGWPQTWWEWHSVMPGLATNHTVIAVDLPGLGASGIPTSGFEKAATARKLHTAMVQLGIPKVSIIGHDLGVAIGYAYARDFPNDVNKVVLIESPLSGFGLEQFYSISFHFLFNMSPAPIPETILDTADVPTYLGMIYDFSFNKPSIDRNRYYLAYSDPDKRHAGFEYYRAFAADAADNVANAASKPLNMPLIAMGGQYSFGPAVGASFTSVAHDVRPVVAPAAGHFVPEENPQFLVDCVKVFLGDSAPSTDPALSPCNA